ncbi:hypothetical protein CU097_004760 [Rhizopus azygosporus]|uniref:Uncharacterized protein n=1 Tax=Rhizopus azygosporus TaxID=86630 RepID=A0A367J4I1_RHIAZ|nr:hypothetical protein CU097_004760 [Rhizopus azygosporus]
MLLEYYWSYIRRSSKMQFTVNGSKEAQAVSQVVEDSTDEPRMTATESVHWNNAEEELAFNIDVSTECTITGHPKQLLRNRLVDKSKVALFAFNDKLIKKATPEEEENDQNEEEYDE